jgi:hypothetical protein
MLVQARARKSIHKSLTVVTTAKIPAQKATKVTAFPHPTCYKLDDGIENRNLLPDWFYDNVCGSTIINKCEDVSAIPDLRHAPPSIEVEALHISQQCMNTGHTKSKPCTSRPVRSKPQRLSVSVLRSEKTDNCSRAKGNPMQVNGGGKDRSLPTCGRTA